MNTEHSEIHDGLDGIEAALAGCDGSAEQIAHLRGGLLGVAESARNAARDDLQTCAGLLADLAEIARCSLTDSGDDSAAGPDALIAFVRTGVSAMRTAADEEASDEIQAVCRQAREQWGDYLSLLEEPAARSLANPADGWDDFGAMDFEDQDGRGSEEVASAESGSQNASPDQIHMILSALGGSKGRAPAAPQQTSAENVGQASPLARTSGDACPTKARTAAKDSSAAPPEPASIDLDAELLEAYLDDANRCLASMEQAALAFEADPQSKGPLQQLCRELHTVKGASASVGLSDLAEYLHKVEDSIQSSLGASGSGVDLEFVLQSVDAVRGQIAALTAPSRTEAPAGGDQGPPLAEAPPPTRLGSGFDGSTPDGEESLRVKASHLDRLMDMLAELVMLRNRRDTHAVRLKRINDELTRCVTRLRAFAEGFGEGDGVRAGGKKGDRHLLPDRPEGGFAQTDGRRAAGPVLSQVSSLTELADDLREIARGLRDVHDPIAEENLAISRFVRQFRQELVELRRLPVSGLFRRLQRSARDAARAEGKQVRLKLVGEHAGLERSLQERIYEPLLHLVRNAVSHGIEREQDRAAAGKDPVGTVTLEAHGGPNLLVLEIRDDGRGLDYEALRRRGLERGLLSPDRPASRQQLSELIFHPGFSTRDTAGEISGRGVGMDVVASTLEKLHSRIEIDSSPGEGTTMRLTIPLRSVIEHTMVFRAGGQLFALPMQSIRAAGRFDGEPVSEDDSTVVRLCDLLSLPDSGGQTPEQMLVLGQGRGLTTRQAAAGGASACAEGAARRVMLLVDEIIGPEEVVVRSLPGLLRQHRLFSGVTLSGAGEIVLLFDNQRLTEMGLGCGASPALADDALPSGESSAVPASNRLRALVVDDSLSARRSLIQKLAAHPFEITQAGDGLEALDRIRAEQFDVVFTDLEMPRLGGLELLSEIRNGRRSRGLRVVMVTSRREDEFRRRARELGADGYLTKPVDDAALNALLDQFRANSKAAPKDKPQFRTGSA